MVNASIGLFLFAAAQIVTEPAIARAGNQDLVGALVHHGYAGECDFNRSIKIVGELTRVAWVNPHVWIGVRTREPSPVTWWIEGDAPYALHKRGWTSALLLTHIQVAAQGYAMRTASTKVCGCRLTLPDDRAVVLSACGADDLTVTSKPVTGSKQAASLTGNRAER